MKTTAALFFSFAVVASAIAVEAPRVSAKEAAKRVADGTAVLVDVRESSEWNETGVAAPAALLPKSDFDGAQKAWKPFLEKNAGKEIILYCRSGHRAGIVAATLAEKGVKVSNAGGLKDWTDAGLPVKKLDAKKE
jgi:rhodanese-related sulfurtransferase